MRNYKKISDCPESLRRIIEGVNHLPVNADEIRGKLIDLAMVATKLSPDKFMETSDFYRAEIKNLGLEKEVLDYIIGEMPTQIMMGFVVQKFSELELAKPVLQNIAEMNSAEIEKYGRKIFTKNQINPIGKIYTFYQKMNGIRFSGTLNLIYGFIRPQISGLTEVFQNENIPPERIRECPICQLIFWAKRVDAKTCGEKECVKTLGGNEYQSDNKDKLNENKRRKYYVDNDIEYCPVCVFPLKNHDEFDDCPTIKRSKNNGTV